MIWTSLTIAALVANPFDGTAGAMSPTPPQGPDLGAIASAGFAFDPAATRAPTLSESPSEWLADSQATANAATAQGATLPPATLPAADSAIARRFFQRGSRRWQVTGAAATQFDDHFALLGVSVSYFIEYDFTIDFELNGMYYEQDEGDSTPGLNLGVLLRWHFLHDHSHGENPHWTVFADAGLGVLFTAHNVPEEGKQFNLTPQVGAGLSWLLDESTDTRLLAGIRWHHTSNANTHENNPGANKIMFYAGLNFPF